MARGVFAAPKQGGPAYDNPIRSHARPKRFRLGATGRIVGHRGSHTGSTRPTASGFECGQTKDYPSAHIPGKFKVEMVKNRIRYCRPTHPQEN